MKITDILSPDMVLPELKGNTKPDVLHELAGYLASKHRESTPRRYPRCSPSASGWARPRSATASPSPTEALRRKQIIGVFGRHERGVDFDSLDGGPTYLFFLLVAPEDSASLHLKALARVSRLMKDPAFRERLSNAPDAAEIFRLIKEEDARH